MISGTVLALACLTVGAAELPGETAANVYSPDPKHLWNRLNETLFIRTAADGRQYGRDQLDILFWVRTKHLLAEPSHQQALAVLDEFINRNGEKLIRDPWKRALLQRDLWELFDWSARAMSFGETKKLFPRQTQELQGRIAVLIHRLALTTNEIASLPDNFAEAERKNLPDLPRGLFQTNGNWVSVGLNNYSDEPVAPLHVLSFNGHSAFSVMLHLPAGRQSAISYLEKLRSFAQLEHVWIYQTDRSAGDSTNSPRDVLELNPDIPQFPTNTEWALVRRMCVIDVEGRIQPTPVTESIQVRRYLQIKRMDEASSDIQQLFQFELDRRQNGTLRAVGKEEGGFPFVQFMSTGIDPFEWSSGNAANTQQSRDSATFQSKVLNTCFQCHFAPGIFSVNSYTGFLSPLHAQKSVDLAPLANEARTAICWKERQYDWGLLQGIWSGQSQTHSH